jgi:hypothetical protein
MKRILTSFLVAALASASVATSFAYTFTVTPLCDPFGTGDFCSPGVTTTAGDSFTSVLAPLAPETLTPPPGAPGSGYSLFLIQTTPNSVPPPDRTGTYNNNTQYFFDISVDGSPVHTFRVDGTVTGSVTFNSALVGGSNAFFQSTLITDLNTGISSAAFALAPDARESLVLPGVDFGNGVIGNLYVDFRQRITPPLGNPASIGGFFGAVAVPEPGAVALLVGSGLGGGLMFFRRRRRA